MLIGRLGTLGSFLPEEGCSDQGSQKDLENPSAVWLLCRESSYPSGYPSQARFAMIPSLLPFHSQSNLKGFIEDSGWTMGKRQQPGQIAMSLTASTKTCLHLLERMSNVLETQSPKTA